MAISTFQFQESLLVEPLTRVRFLELLSRLIDFPLSGMKIPKHRDPWVIRICFTTILLGTFLALKFWLDLYPGMNPYYFPTQLSKESSACQPCDLNLTGPMQPTNARSSIPNSFLPCEDYVSPGSSTFTLGNISHYFKTAVEDSELLHAAQAAARKPLAPGPPSVAFLFILRRGIPLRPVWERFFTGIDHQKYSIYTHSSISEEVFPNNSVFHNRSICSKDVERFSISLVDVVRRLLAFALLDTEKPNMWFTLVSESGAPIRSFPYIYEYFMKSNTSFVEAYSPMKGYRRWPTEPHFRRDQLRKGELWISVHRRHAGMIVGDMLYYRKFKRDCSAECTVDEEYMQTFLSVKDSKVRSQSEALRVWDPCESVMQHLSTAVYFSNSRLTLVARSRNQTLH